MVVALIKWKRWKKTNYEISNFGHVRNFVTFELLKPQTHYKGHLTIFLCHKGIKKKYFVHRLVAILFIKRVKGKLIVNHKDTDKQNNYYLNLEWCTISENTKHAFDHGLIDMEYVRSCKTNKVA